MVYINAEGVGTSFTCTLGFFVKKTIEISSRTRIITNQLTTGVPCQNALAMTSLDKLSSRELPFPVLY